MVSWSDLRHYATHAFVRVTFSLLSPPCYKSHHHHHHQQSEWSRRDIEEAINCFLVFPPCSIASATEEATDGFVVSGELRLRLQDSADRGLLGGEDQLRLPLRGQPTPLPRCAHLIIAGFFLFFLIRNTVWKEKKRKGIIWEKSKIQISDDQWQETEAYHMGRRSVLILKNMVDACFPTTTSSSLFEAHRVPPVHSVIPSLMICLTEWLHIMLILMRQTWPI